MCLLPIPYVYLIILLCSGNIHKVNHINMIFITIYSTICIYIYTVGTVPHLLGTSHKRSMYEQHNNIIY